MKFLRDPNHRQQAAIAALVVAVALFLSAKTVADPDLWGHVRFGQDMLAQHGIPRVDPYSYLTAGQPWINHEWFVEVLFAAAFNAMGPVGLLALKTSLLLAIIVLVYWHLCRHGANVVQAGAIVVAVTYTMSVGDHTIRPHLFTYLFFLLLMLVIYAAETRHPRAVWLAPPLIVLWANCHGGFLAGLAVLGIWAAARIATAAVHALTTTLRSLASGYWPLATAVLASVAAALLTPYGPRLLTFLLETATVPRPEIQEWQPIDVTKNEGLAYLALVVISIVAMATSKTRRPALAAVLLCLAILPLQAFRHLPLFALGVGVLAGPSICEAWSRLSQAKESFEAPARFQWTAALLPLTGAMLFCNAAAKDSLKIGIDPQQVAYPARAVQLLKSSGVRGNLAIYFDWGEYAIWHLGPGIKVSIDGRRETVYTAKVRALSNRWFGGVGDWDALLDHHPTDMALIDKTQPGYNLMRLKRGWTRVYDDPLCALFARSGSPLAATLTLAPRGKLPADGAGLSFP
jgi:hypothetical protein